jgi:hypothetical protein
MAKRVTLGELLDFADARGIEYEEGVSYSEMRELVDVGVCKQCGNEHLKRYSEKYCSDGCEAAYISENFR